jgi:Na+-driven multidrug efflux pump
MNFLHIGLSLAVGFVVGLLVGRNNPSLASAAAKYVASVKTDFDAAVAKVNAKLGR